MKILFPLFSLFCLIIANSVSASDADKFVGIWFIDAIEIRDESGNWIASDNPIVGLNPIGFISYDSNGNMSVQLMRQERSKFNAHPRDVPSTEISEAFYSYVAYFGTYEVNEDEGTVTHHRVGSLVPDESSEDGVRFYIFGENTLTLMPNDGRRLRWRKP